MIMRRRFIGSYNIVMHIMYYWILTSTSTSQVQVQARCLCLLLPANLPITNKDKEEGRVLIGF